MLRTYIHVPMGLQITKCYLQIVYLAVPGDVALGNAFKFVYNKGKAKNTTPESIECANRIKSALEKIKNYAEQQCTEEAKMNAFMTVVEKLGYVKANSFVRAYDIINDDKELEDME